VIIDRILVNQRYFGFDCLVELTKRSIRLTDPDSDVDCHPEQTLYLNVLQIITSF